MKTIMTIIASLLLTASYGQTMQIQKVVIPSDSIYEMSKPGGRSQTVIAAPGSDNTIMIESIAVSNKVFNRLYSPDSATTPYQIGYASGNYWYEITAFDFGELNVTANTTVSFLPLVSKRHWGEPNIRNAPVKIKFATPLNFTQGENELTLYVTYWIVD